MTTINKRNSINPKLSISVNQPGLLNKYIPYLREQSYEQLICNYYSNYPQPFMIEDIDQFNNIYVDFDLSFYIKTYNLSSLPILAVLNHYHLFGKYNKALFNPNIKLVFYTPPIDNNTGGIDAIFNMAHNINNIGYKNIKAYVYSYDHTKPKNKLCNFYINPHQIDSKTIVIYPEVIPNNPLNSYHVIRWILLELGIEVPNNQYKSWKKTDLVYHWEPNPKYKYLENLTNIFGKHENLPCEIQNKTKTCFLYRKAKYLGPETFHGHRYVLHDTDSIDLDLLVSDRNKIIECLKECKYMYSYDPNTFWNIVAPLNGCITILHPVKGMSREDYFKSRILGGIKNEGVFDAGIAYGNNPKQLKRAQETLPFANEQFHKMCKVFNKTADNMLKNLYNYIEFNIPLNNTVQNLYYENSITH